MESEEIPYITDPEAYNNGLKNLFECYDECLKDEQMGGAKVKRYSKTSSILSKIFSPNTKSGFTRVIRGAVRTGGGLAADIITVGAGGDVVVNGLFAIESSITFLNQIETLVTSLEDIKSLFDKLMIIDFSKTIPIYSKIRLDGGYQAFEYDFNIILASYVKEYGSKFLDKMHDNVIKIIDKITTTVSDWIACLFPDTAGLAGEISKTILDYIAKNGYSYVYNLTSILPDTLQRMITNIYALKDLVRKSLIFLRDLLKNLNNQQVAEVIQSLGVKASDLTSSGALKSIVGVGTKAVTLYAKAISYTPAFLILAQAKKILVYVIDRYVLPNIDTGVDLFDQLYPMFLMFTLYIEQYPSVIKGKITITPPKIVVPPTDNEELKAQEAESNAKVVSSFKNVVNAIADQSGKKDSTANQLFNIAIQPYTNSKKTKLFRRDLY